MTRPDRRTPLSRGHEPNTVGLGGAAAGHHRAGPPGRAHHGRPRHRSADARELLAPLGLIDDLGQPTP